MAITSLAFYGYAWLVQPNRPQLAAVFDEPPAMVNVTESGPDPSPEHATALEYQKWRWGWYGEWYDQFHYARMARSLGRFELPGTEWDHRAKAPESGAASSEPASYSYGLGYPIVGAAFFLMGFEGDPFVVPNGLLMAAAACLTLRMARRLLPPTAALAATVALILAAPYVKYFVIPYSNSLTAVAVLVAINVALDGRWSLRQGLAVGAAAGLCVLGRYLDGMVVLALLAPFVLRHLRRALPFAGVVAACVALAAGVVLYTQDRVFGSPTKTPYHFTHAGNDASLDSVQPSQVPDAFVGVFLSGDRSALFGVEPVLRQAPWLALAPVGLVLMWRRRERFAPVALWSAAVGAASSLFYLAWVFGGTDDLPYWIIRFHTPFFPLATVLSAYVFLAASRLLTRDDL